MFQAVLCKEIVVRTENDTGVLWDIARTVAERGVDVRAVGAWVEGRNGVVRLVTDDNLRAREALTKKGYTAQEEPAVSVEVPHKPGMLKHLSEPLKEQSLDIHHLYGSACGGPGTCLIIFSCSHNDRAVVAINKIPSALHPAAASPSAAAR